MKVGIWLKENYSPEEGGGYSYYDKLIKAIDNHAFGKSLEIVFVSSKLNFPCRKKLINLGHTSLLSLLLQGIAEFVPFTKPKHSLLQNAFRRKYNKLAKEGIDILYYPQQLQRKIPDFPFVATNWDLGHLSTFPFPELTSRGEFTEREYWYKKNISQALLIFAESEAGKKELVNYLNINPSRIKVVPLFAGDLPSIEDDQQADILRTLKLENNSFYFYPAQFWAHKNHYALLCAFKTLKETNPLTKLVFTGADKGNLSYIKDCTTKMGLQDSVLFLGFVSQNVLYTLYKNAAALVMPSYLGPTNMPLLEARELGCPVICADLEGHREMMGEGALYFNLSDIHTLAEKMKQILDNQSRQALLTAAQHEKSSSPFTIETAIEKIEQYLIELIAVRKTWK